MTTFEGTFATPSGRFAIIAARFNAVIVDDLLAGALDAFQRHGVLPGNIDVVRVPGSFEIPLIAQHLGQSGKYAALVCLGAIVKGETGHYDHVASATTSGIAQAGLASGIPVIFGVLTCDTIEQAINRAGGKSGNKGFEAAVTAIEMANLLKQLPE